MQKKEPFFSIVTCTYNSERYIKNNITSVNNQTYKNYEQIFIDGKSDDATINLIRYNVKKRINAVKVYYQKPQGVASAFNLGLKKTKGSYVIFLNSDDSFYDKNVLSKINKLLMKNDDLDWIYGKINVILPKGKNVGVFPDKKIFQLHNSYLLKYFNYIPHQAVFMRRSLFKKFGSFNERLKSSMDYDYFLRVAPKTKWHFFNEIVSNYLVRTDSVSSSKKDRENNQNIYMKVQKKYLNTFEYALANFINLLIFKINKIYKSQEP